MTMLEIGSTVEAEVIALEPYGVYLRHGDHEILVLITEVAWKPTHDLGAAVRIGERRPVYLLRYNYEANKYSGSFRRTQPEKNPYRALSRLPPGHILTGKVGMFASGQWTIHLPDGVWGHLLKTNGCPDWKTGDQVRVRIAGVEVDDAHLTLAPAPQTPPVTNGLAVTTVPSPPAQPAS